MYTLKDFGLYSANDVSERAENFQIYINQQSMYKQKSYWTVSEGPISTRMKLEGGVKEVDAYIGNDYLGLSQCKETIAAGIDAMQKYGTGACAAPIIGGYLDIHYELEKRISQFVGKDDAILFSSGFGANDGLLRSLLGKKDIALIDTYIHASAQCGLLGTNVKHIGHNDMTYLEQVLKTVQNKYQTKLVIIDGVYSQDGDLAKLPEIIELSHKYGAMVMVDDAHGIGVFGPAGRGTSEHFNCLGEPDIITGTFSKSFGCVGGFVAASEKLIQHFRYYVDSCIFSASPTPQVTASVLKALDIVEQYPEIRQNLWSNVNYLRRRLLQEGFDIGSTESPIFPIMVRDNEKVYHIADMLAERSIFAFGIVFPAVRLKEARMRISIQTTHNHKQLEHLVASLIEIDKVIKIRNS